QEADRVHGHRRDWPTDVARNSERWRSRCQLGQRNDCSDLMAYTAHVFTQFMDSMAGNKTVNLDTDPFRVILATATTTGIAAAQDTVVTMTDLKAVTGWTEVATGVG